jgi:hypothetical protein
VIADFAHLWLIYPHFTGILSLARFVPFGLVSCHFIP